jgi:hypothetical protein
MAMSAQGKATATVTVTVVGANAVAEKMTMMAVRPNATEEWPIRR